VAEKTEGAGGCPSMNKYMVYRISRGKRDVRTIEAKSNTSAKRIACRQDGNSPSDYFCGLSNYTATLIKKGGDKNGSEFKPMPVLWQ